MQRSSIGLGPALRKVRERRGVSLAEASRDTRIRAEFLEALEDEDFDRLLGDVHVRGCLRSYATYLGVPGDRVLEVYSQHASEPVAAPQPPKLPAEQDIHLPRRRDNARLVIMGAVAIFVLAAAFGVVSARDPAPPPAQLPTTTPSLAAVLGPPAVDVSVLARVAVDLTVTIDGAEPRTYALEAGEGRSFEGDSSVGIDLSRGGTAEISVNGRFLGVPGRTAQPWHRTYRASQLPSASPSVSP